MWNNTRAGIIAGIVAGLGFGIMMTVMHAPTPGGGSMPMMAMVAKVVGSTSLAIGWLYHLFNSAVIGGLFGWIPQLIEAGERPERRLLEQVLRISLIPAAEPERGPEQGVQVLGQDFFECPGGTGSSGQARPHKETR